MARGDRCRTAGTDSRHRPPQPRAGRRRVHRAAEPPVRSPNRWVWAPRGSRHRTRSVRQRPDRVDTPLRQRGRGNRGTDANATRADDNANLVMAMFVSPVFSCLATSLRLRLGDSERLHEALPVARALIRRIPVLCAPSSWQDSLSRAPQSVAHGPVAPGRSFVHRRIVSIVGTARPHQTNCWPPSMSYVAPVSAVLAIRWMASAATSAARRPCRSATSFEARCGGCPVDREQDAESGVSTNPRQ